MAKHRIFMCIMLAASFLFGCGRTADEGAAPSEPPGGSVTAWTSRTELFMEHPALIVGKEIRFAVHLTWLSDFKAVAEGRLSLAFTSTAGSRSAASVEKPASPGIFRPTITFEQPGIYTLIMTIHGAGQDTMEIEGFHVFPSSAEVPSDEVSRGDELIPFLKEQQWKIDFRTEPVVRRSMSGNIRAAAEILPQPNSEAIVSAPFTGTIPAEGNEILPVVGQDVAKGARLAAMIPSAETPSGIENFSSRFIEAETNRSLAKSELERAKRLRDIEGISEKEYQEAESAFKRADATYGTLSTYVQSDSDGRSPGTFALKAPLSGTIMETHVVRGKQIDAGAPLYRIINTRSVWVRASVASTEIGKVARPRTAWLQLSGGGAPLEINERNGTLISVAAAIDPATRTFPVIFEVRNHSGNLRVGMFGEINIAAGKANKVLVVAESALIEEEGRYSVYVHVEGEAFAKRDVTLGDRNGEYVGVLSGLSEGERVVTVGAYQVRLASLSSQLPAHGHEH